MREAAGNRSRWTTKNKKRSAIAQRGEKGLLYVCCTQGTQVCYVRDSTVVPIEVV